MTVQRTRRQTHAFIEAAMLALLAALASLVGVTFSAQPQEKDGPGPAADLLARIEARSHGLTTLHAKLTYDRIQGLLGDKQRRVGELWYAGGPPARFAVHFDKLLVNRRAVQQDRWYIFDGQWLVERLDDKKQFIKRQVVAPPTKDAPNPKPADPLALGQGPFPVPIKIKKDEVLKRFEVTIIDPSAKDDPKDTKTHHLRLVPKKDRRNILTRIDLWFDQSTLLPVQVRTMDESENETVVALRDTKVDEPIEKETFDTAVPKGDGWLIEIKPWEP